MVELVSSKFQKESVEQYKSEEATVARRILSFETRCKHLLDCMVTDNISSSKNIEQLREDIYEYSQLPMFLNAKTWEAWYVNPQFYN